MHRLFFSLAASFVYGFGPRISEASAFVRRVLQWLEDWVSERDVWSIRFVRNRRCISAFVTPPPRQDQWRPGAAKPHKLQVILRSYDGVDGVIGGFDVPCCSVAWDGQRFYATPMGVVGMVYGNIMDPTRASPTFVRRLCKYAKRDFSIVLPYTTGQALEEVYPADKWYWREWTTCGWDWLTGTTHKRKIRGKVRLGKRWTLWLQKDYLGLLWCKNGGMSAVMLEKRSFSATISARAYSIALVH